MMKFEPKAIHDEMNSSTFDEFGRMQANLGIEAMPPSPATQNVTLYPYVNPQTELIDGTNLPFADTKVRPISDMKDGSQIWRITHNGVDTHPIHFHLYDVQVLNRVTWDNIVIPTEPSELGWKDTVRISPLEDTIVALRPIIPKLPWEIPNSVRTLSPMMPAGPIAGQWTPFNNINGQGQPAAAIENRLINFGWEYIYHCHILSHEEMDMMRPVSLAMPPLKADTLSSSITGNGNSRRIRISWNDNSITETSFVLQRTANGTTWTDVGTSPSPLNQANTHGTRALTDATSNANTPYEYRVAALNTVGYGAEFPSMTVQSVSLLLGVNMPQLPAAPTSLTATVQSGPKVLLTWQDNATTETGFIIERATGAGAFSQLATAPARSNTGPASYTDTTTAAGTKRSYRVTAVNLTGPSAAPSNVATVVIPALPGQPVFTKATVALTGGNNERITATWSAATGAAGYTLQWSASSAFTNVSGSSTLAANVTSATTSSLSRRTWYLRVLATNTAGSTASPIATVPLTAPPVLGVAARSANTVTMNLAQPGFIAAASVGSVASSHTSRVKGVRIQWTRSRTFKHPTGARTVGPRVHKVTVRHLKAHTWYSFRARILTKDGHSAWSKTVRVRTKK